MLGVGLSRRTPCGPRRHPVGQLQRRDASPLGAGQLTLNLQATRVLQLESEAVTLDGYAFAGDNRLGNLNFANAAAAAPKWRANAFASWAWGPHTIRLQENYVSAVSDKRLGVQYGEAGEDWITTDIYYQLTITDALRLSLSVVNLFDRDPPPAQEEFGYDPLIASPLGRTFEIGVRKSF